MSLFVRVIPFALIGVGIFAFMVGGPSSTPSAPAREHVSVTVMMNSNFARGQGPSSAPCMVLFDIDQPGPVSAGKLTEMQRIASEIYSLYENGASGDEDQEMADFIRHLENDMYHPHSRKAVPSALANGRRLYVADIMLHRHMLNSEMRRIAMVKVTGEARGTIYQAPWNASLVADMAMQ